MSNTFTWWGYIHENGSIQVKRYFDQEDIDDALQSPFVQKVVRPFQAESRDDAIKHIQDLYS